MEQPKYKRVLIKISGEALAGDKHFGLDFQVMARVADVIKECVDMGVQVGVVIGGGNFWRGVKDGEGHIERTRADHMGMLATAMNCMAMADVLEQKGVDVRVQTALEIKEVAEPYIRAGFVENGKSRNELPEVRADIFAAVFTDLQIVEEEVAELRRSQEIFRRGAARRLNRGVVSGDLQSLQKFNETIRLREGFAARNRHSAIVSVENIVLSDLAEELAD